MREIEWNRNRENYTDNRLCVYMLAYVIKCVTCEKERQTETIKVETWREREKIAREREKGIGKRVGKNETERKVEKQRGNILKHPFSIKEIKKTSCKEYLTDQ